MTAAPALALLIAGGLTGCALWPGPVGGGAAVDLRVGDGGEAVSDEEMDQVVGVLRQRIAAMGQGRPDITPGDGAVTVELPPDMDPAEAIDLMERPGAVTIHQVVDGADETVEDPTGVEMTLPDPDSPVQLQLGPARIDNDGIDSAEPELDTSGSQWEVHLTFTSAGAESWTGVTGEAACSQEGSHQRRIAIVVDEEVVSGPEIAPGMAREAGIDFVDHADIYGPAVHACERRFAEAMRLTPSERDSLTIQAKAGIMPEGPYFDHSYEHITASVEGSLRALDTDRLAERYGVPPVAVATAWITRHPARMQVVLGITTPERVSGAALGSDLALTRPEWYELTRAVGHRIP
ncbi:aldo/keto reductase [Nocardiopsis exhalans]|uniref:Aldo/keto reductase n=1 Tax=Nocardiopsis exhalans TaxID=163604 RepID=A0ABY5D0P9_9ACTN|nr:aldo/keto reductase [Nocardiopsis exhalans]USY17256.1 aldo/keto reductase [Nocardiopsis exhalans]